jgi:hypothetical protein
MFYVPIILGVFMNAWSGNYMRKRAESRLANPYTPLPDMLHDCFPKIPLLVPDLFLFICMMLAVYNRAYLVEMERHVFNIGICSIIRSFSVCLTTMPTCMAKPKGEPNVYTKFFLNTHDLMFSGHSLFFIGIGKMLNSVSIPIIGPFLLVVARQHYTIDVCVSGLVYFLVSRS